MKTRLDFHFPQCTLKDKPIKTSTEVLRRSPQWAFNTDSERDRERESKREREVY